MARKNSDWIFGVLSGPVWCLSVKIARVSFNGAFTEIYRNANGIVNSTLRGRSVGLRKIPVTEARRKIMQPPFLTEKTFPGRKVMILGPFGGITAIRCFEPRCLRGASPPVEIVGIFLFVFFK